MNTNNQKAKSLNKIKKLLDRMKCQARSNMQAADALKYRLDEFKEAMTRHAQVSPAESAPVSVA